MRRHHHLICKRLSPTSPEHTQCIRHRAPDRLSHQSRETWSQRVFAHSVCAIKSVTCHCKPKMRARGFHRRLSSNQVQCTRVDVGGWWLQHGRRRRRRRRPRRRHHSQIQSKLWRAPDPLSYMWQNRNYDAYRPLVRIYIATRGPRTRSIPTHECVCV